METNNILGDNIRTYRKALGLTGEDLSQRMGISRQSLQMHQSGQRIPKPDHIKKYAEIFGISAETLENTPHPKSYNFVVYDRILWEESES